MNISDLAWTPTSGYPTTHPSTLTSIATSCVPHIQASLSHALVSMQTQTYYGELAVLSEVVRGAEASLSIISAQEVLATATDASVQAEATTAIYEAMYNLHELAEEKNLYGYYLNRGGNIFFLAVYALLWLFFLGAMVKSRYHWFNVTFVCGYTLEFLGFLGRVLAFTDNTYISYFLLQFVCLTLAPAFIMGGIYFLFAQNVAIYGRQYSVLKPMWYSYFFIACDVTSLVIQGIGGGMASAANAAHMDAAPGTWTMFGGIIFQVVAMSIFIIFWLEFVLRLYFMDRKEIKVDSPFRKRTPTAFFKLLFDTPSAVAYKRTQLEPFYNPKYAHLRDRKLVRLYPIAVTLAVAFIYIRCIYRVVELYEGFAGYLITHEVFLMTLDASMIALAGLIFVSFHPVFGFGRINELSIKDVTAQGKESSAKNIEIPREAEKYKEGDEPSLSNSEDPSEESFGRAVVQV